MKKLVLSLLVGAAAASSAVAGQAMVGKEAKGPVAEPCFRDMELQLDVFGSYTDAKSGSDHGDGFGGGIAVNYFFTRYLGVGVDGNLYDGDVNGAWDITGRVIARYPLELGSLCLAPYVFGGGGVSTDGTNLGSWVAGGGLEWRATHQFGVFAEGRYSWAAQNNDAAQARLGVRFVF